MSYMLGIDTGGTYTDAVLLSATQGVTATAKSLTTRYDLSVGISESVESLPAELRSSIQLVSLSTTLATNAVVEGFGSRVCILLAGYDDIALKRSKIPELLGDSPVVLLNGGHDAGGGERAKLDIQIATATIERYRDEVTAFAISASFSVRNPAHENALAALVASLTDKPVTCGHQLATGLDAPRRALTAALNARLIPYIHNLLAAVQRSLKRVDISAPIMVVKGDGSLINADTAINRPIETILSGPAASVIGACFLSGQKDAIVADMGGTTTDVAIIRGGELETSSDGALIGDWRPMTEAVKVYSIGLGGDSEVRFKAGVGMDIGPRRVLPLSLLTYKHPELLDTLKNQANSSATPRLNRFGLRFQHDPFLISQLDDTEKDVWDRLGDGPLELESLALQDRNLSRALSRLHRIGLVIYSGFTPSDAAHVLQHTDHWCEEGAGYAARIWAKQMRHLYGFGKWKKDDAIGPSESVMEMVAVKITQVLLRSGLNQLGIHDNKRADSYAQMLGELLIERDLKPGAEVFSLGFSQSLSLIGAGAPAHCYFPRVAEILNLQLDIPHHSAVSNAIGAIAGRVIQHAKVLVTQPEQGVYRLHSESGPQDYSTLEEAFLTAEQLASKTAMALAISAGATLPEIKLRREENAVAHDIDGYMFFEATVIATATSEPFLTA